MSSTKKIAKITINILAINNEGIKLFDFPYLIITELAPTAVADAIPNKSPKILLDS